MESLTLSQVASIGGVRELLAEAARRVGDRSVGGRHVAVVLLDAAVEAAVGVCLGEWGDAPSERDSLADMQQRLKRLLGTKAPAGWRDVNRLRRARNLAQHHQVPIDSETLAGLYAPVSRYIEDLIRLTFGFRMSDVVLAMAVEDRDVGMALQAVEVAINIGDAQGAVDGLREIFGQVRASWASSVGRATVRPDPFNPVSRSIAEQTAELRDLIEVVPFAADPAEYVWFRRVISLNGAMGSTTATVDDARRGLQFVVSWITRWEAYVRTHRELTERERQARRIIASPSGRPHGRPEWVEAPTIRATLRSIEIDGALAWGEPGDDDDRAEAWAEALARVLRRTITTSDRRFALSAGYLSAAWTDYDNDDPAVMTSRVDQLMDAIRDAFDGTVVELQAVLADRDRAVADHRGREEAAERLLAAARSTTGEDVSPFVAASSDPHGFNSAHLHVHEQFARWAAQRVDVASDVGHWYNGASGPVWAVPLDTSLDVIAAAAPQWATALLDAAAHDQVEQQAATSIQSAAAEIVALRWRE